VDSNVESLSTWFREESCGAVEDGEERLAVGFELEGRDVFACDIARSAVDNDPWFNGAGS
jgi:hypothetical protein